METSTITLEQIQRCPHRSLAPTHYRDNGTCHCADRKGNLQAIVVTVDGGFEGGKKTKYVVVEEYDRFVNIKDQNLPATAPPNHFNGNGAAALRDAREAITGRFYFGCQQVKRNGVDEMYRTLGSYEICKIQRLPYEKVWGTGR